MSTKKEFTFLPSPEIMAHFSHASDHSARSRYTYGAPLPPAKQQDIALRVRGVTAEGASTRSLEIQSLESTSNTHASIVYWMNRDCRIADNYALVYAEQLAYTYNVPLIIVYNLQDSFLGGMYRNYHFKVSGLIECAEDATVLGIPFTVLHHSGNHPEKQLLEILSEYHPLAVVTDFSPLSIHIAWKTYVETHIKCPLFEVDTHNIVPCWIASPKQEFAARTFRPKIARLLPTFLVPPQSPVGLSGIHSAEHHHARKEHAEPHKGASHLASHLDPHVYTWLTEIQSRHAHLYSNLDMKRMKTLIDHGAKHDETPLTWIIAGGEAGQHVLHDFLSKKIKHYSALRNDPLAEATSELSPYMHYGQVSPQRIAYETCASAKTHGYSSADILPTDEKIVERAHDNEEIKNYSVFLEELIVRRELADNFCLYTPTYDSFEGFPEWAQKSLNARRDDPREHVYTKKEFERAETHDELWNAAQQELLQRGKMHGYMRMYWAKKILEWTRTPEDALAIAIYLNDTYELDGRDPNGYTGIAWSIGGLHDRPWFKRPVFGDIRFMARSGADKKFDTQAYIDRWNGPQKRLL
jgi:deoxyribodipyrimidine photo-lyase